MNKYIVTVIGDFEGLVFETKTRYFDDEESAKKAARMQREFFDQWDEKGTVVVAEIIEAFN